MAESGAQFDRIVRERRVTAAMHIIAGTVQAYQFTLQLPAFATHTVYAPGFGFRAMLALAFPLWPYVVSWAVARTRTTTGKFTSAMYWVAFVSIATGFVVSTEARFGAGIGIAEYFLRTVVLSILLVSAAILSRWYDA